MPDLESADKVTHRDPGWWAVYTRHQHEKSVARMLSGKGIEVFLPLFDATRRWKDRNKLLSLPMFPCYLFVRGAEDRRLLVVSTPGVHMLLMHGDHIARVPEVEIEAIRRTIEADFRVTPHPFLQCGERVRIKKGPLQGVEGILIRKKNEFRLVLSVEMLTQSVGVEVEAADTEPIALEPVAANFTERSRMAPTNFYSLKPRNWATIN